MKIAVFSDTHGSVSRLPLIKASLKDIDAVLHLGDLAPDGVKIASELGVPCYAVLGNCAAAIHAESFLPKSSRSSPLRKSYSVT